MRKLSATVQVAALLLAAAPAAVAAPVPGVTASPFGAQCVWPVNGDLETILDRMQQAGIEWGRFDLCWWSLAETTPGVYDFTSPDVSGWEGWNTDRAISLMHARGIEPFPILCYANPMYDGGNAPYSAAGRAAFGDYCYAAAHRYRDTVTYWEIWNEPNLSMFWGPTPDAEDYALLAQTAAARIRAANPDAVIVGGVTAGIDLTFLGTAFDHGLLDAVDVITVHPYRIAAPESINGEIASLRAMIAARTTRDINVWTGEWGFDTAWTEVTPLGQAKCLSRMMVNNLSQEIGLSIWFSTHPFTEHSATDPGWGLLDYSYNPRPSYAAMQVLNTRLPAPVALDPAPFSVALSPAVSDQRIEVFRRGDDRHRTVAVWAARWQISDSDPGTSTMVRLNIPEAATVTAFDGLSGAVIALDSTYRRGWRELSGFLVRDYPVFIEVEFPAAANTLSTY